MSYSAAGPIQMLKEQYNVDFINREDAEAIEDDYRNKYKAFLDIQDFGYTVLTKTNPKIELSKGCAACKKGSWLCIFVGYNCNADCSFCPQDEINRSALDGKLQTSFGNLYELKYLINSLGAKVDGISYSGGEPLLYLDKILNIASYVQEYRPDMYQWVYTNGILLNEDNLAKLKEVGIAEIRFNLAATHFGDKIIEKIPVAKKYIERITVEVPAVPEIRCLTENNLIEKLIDYGVCQLNIAELSILNSKTADNYCHNSKIMCHMQRGSAFTLAESTDIFYELVEYVQKNNLNILLNHCDHNAKMIQAISKEINNIPNT